MPSAEEFRLLKENNEHLLKENRILSDKLELYVSTFHSRIITFIEGLLGSDKLRTPTKNIPGHSFVIDARCNFWPRSEVDGRVIADFSHMSANACELLIHWIYFGRVIGDHDQSIYVELLRIASQFKMDDLFSKCEDRLMNLATNENYLQLSSAAHELSAHRLLKHCTDHIALCWVINPNISIHQNDLHPSQVASINVNVLMYVILKIDTHPLHMALKMNRDDVAVRILESDPVKAELWSNELDGDGIPPLFLALTQQQFIKFAGTMLKFGVNLNLRFRLKESEFEPLWYHLVEARQFHALDVLVKLGCDLACTATSQHLSLLHVLARSQLTGSSSEVTNQLVILLDTLSNQSSAHVNARDLAGKKDEEGLALVPQTQAPLGVVNLLGLKPPSDDLSKIAVTTLNGRHFRRHDSAPPSFPPVDNFTASTPAFASTLASPPCNANVNAKFSKRIVTDSNLSMTSTTVLAYAGETMLSVLTRLGLEQSALFLLQHPVIDPQSTGYDLIDADSSIVSISGNTILHEAIDANLDQLAMRLIGWHQVDPNKLRRIVKKQLPPITTATTEFNSIPSNSTGSSTSSANHSQNSPSINRPIPKPRSSPNIVRNDTRKGRPKSVKSLNPFDDDDEQGVGDLFRNEPEEAVSNLTAPSTSSSSGGGVVGCAGRSPPRSASKASRSQEHVLVEEYHSPLHLAFYRDMPGIVEFYVNSHSKASSVDWLLLDQSGDSLFSLALWSSSGDNFDLASRILIATSRHIKPVRSDEPPHGGQSLSPKHGSVLWKLTSGNRHSLLQRAIHRDNFDAVQFLVRHGADVNQSYGQAPPPPSQIGASDPVCPLWSALERDNHRIANLLISRTADVDYWSSSAELPINFSLSLLHRAILTRNCEAAAYLIANFCDINASVRTTTDNISHLTLDSDACKHNSTWAVLRPDLQWAPIHMSIVCDQSGALLNQLLSCSRTDVNKKDAAGNSAVHLAVIHQAHSQLALLLSPDNLVDCSSVNAANHTAFHLALLHRNVKAAQSLLERNPALACKADHNGRTILHLSIANLDRQAIFFLIQAGVDMNQPVADSKTQYAPIHLAVIAGVPEDIFRTLVLAGASVNAQSVQLTTPLHLAVLHNRHRLMQCLLDFNVKVNMPDAEGNTPLHLAAQSAHIKCLNLLIAHPKINPGRVNKRGQSPIHLAVQQSVASVGVELVTKLVNAFGPAQLAAKDSLGNTPLLLAYVNSSTPICEQLIRCGSPLNDTNVNGQNLFSLSRKKTGSTIADPVLARILDALVQEPSWNDGPECLECLTKFTIKTRKHHCRHCGRLLCNSCSSHMSTIVKFNHTKPISRTADVDYWSSSAELPINFSLSLLHRAILTRNCEAAAYLIANFCDINASVRTTTDNLSHLTLDSDACKHNSTWTVLRPDLQWAPIHMSIVCDQSGALLNHLLSCSRTDVNKKDAAGNSAVHLAVIHQAHSQLALLLSPDNLVDCSSVNAANHTAFHLALLHRNVKAAQSLLERNPALACKADHNGRTILHLSIANLDRQAIFFLIQAGVDMNQPVADSKTQYAPIHLAVIAGVPEDIFRTLVLAGASVNAQSAQLTTPLHLAVLHNRHRLMQCLLDFNVKVNMPDAEGNTPLHLAAQSAHIKCLDLLIAHPKINPGRVNKRGQSPIHLAVQQSVASVGVELVTKLVNAFGPAQLAAKDSLGNTPLLLAYVNSSTTICEQLIRCGSPLNDTNVNGQNLFSLSRKKTGSTIADPVLARILDALVQEPSWNDGPECLECLTKFTIKNRKHHCRHCGRLLCNSCSSHMSTIVKFNHTKPVRVCQTCFHFINNPLG